MQTLARVAPKVTELHLLSKMPQKLVRKLRRKHDLITLPSCLHPFADPLLALAVLIPIGGINEVPPMLKK